MKSSQCHTRRSTSAAAAGFEVAAGAVVGWGAWVAAAAGAWVAAGAGAWVGAAAVPAQAALAELAAATKANSIKHRRFSLSRVTVSAPFAVLSEQPYAPNALDLNLICSWAGHCDPSLPRRRN